MSESEKLGLFHACYNIVTPVIGAPVFELNLTVYTPGETLHGLGKIKQSSINPPLNITTKLDGNFTYMTVMPDITHILVTASGYPIVHWPSYGGVGPVILPNVQLRMVLDDNWKSGTANYKYIDLNGNWQSINGATVESVSCPVLV